MEYQFLIARGCECDEKGACAEGGPECLTEAVGQRRGQQRRKSRRRGSTRDHARVNRNGGGGGHVWPAASGPIVDGVGAGPARGADREPRGGGESVDGTKQGGHRPGQLTKTTRRAGDT